MVMLQIHGCLHMLCTWHGRLLSAQTESKMNFPCCFILKDPILLLLWWEKCTSAVTRRVAEQVMRRHAPECGHQGPGVGASLASVDSVGVSYQDWYFGWSLLSQVC